MAYTLQPQPVKVVGSSVFGIYPKISVERTYNMFISDGWLINYAGYRRVNSQIDGAEGRGAFHSIRGNFYIAVVDDKVYRVNTALGATQVGTLNTRFGEVFIDENLSSQICIVDGNDAWIYNYSDSSFTKQTLTVSGIGDVIPGYVTYHNSFFLIAPSVNDPNNTFNWYAFQYATDSTISHVTESTFPLQSKPDYCLAVKRLPGKGNNVLAIGSTVCEVYNNVGGLENYRPNSSFNIDSGCISISTIAANDQFVCFLSQNQENAPAILVTDGGSQKFISTDGIDHLLESIEKPEKSTAFFYKQNGHLFYQLTFFAPEDNLTLIYDFKTDKFYDVTDADGNYHPARQVAFFAGRTIFVGQKKGSLYELSTNIDGAFEEVGSDTGITIPRIRHTNTINNNGGKPFYCNNLEVYIEQGVTDFPKALVDVETCVDAMITEDTGEEMITEAGDTMITEEGYCTTNADRPAVDLRLSKNGNQSFSNAVRKYLNPQGVYRNRLQYHRLGFANEITLEFRFWGLNRFVVKDGVLQVGV